MQWILENVDGVRAAAERGDALFGTTDTWVLWNLTGGLDGGVHITDVTNASRTMLMDLETLDWDDELLGFFGIPRAMLPAISSARRHRLRHDHRRRRGRGEVPITGVLGDQQAAMVGQVCFAAGEAKNTYGTGNFLLLNTGEEIVRRKNGLLTTVCYRFGDAQAGLRARGLDRRHRLGGAVAARPARHHLRRLGESRRSRHPSTDTGGVYFVPAFSGCSRPTGAPTPAARSSGCRGSTPTPTSRGRRSRRSATRPATSSTRWPPTPASP